MFFFFVCEQLQFWTYKVINNLSSLEIRVSTYISAKLKKRTYMYDSLQFPVEINTRGSKTDNFYSFSHEVWFTGTVWIIFSQLLAEWYVMTSKQF